MDTGDELNSKIVPRELRNLRACKLCSLVKTIENFMNYGCDNCEHLLKMRNNKALVDDFTSNTYDGIISLMSPKESWVGKWKRIDTFVPGCYAISVTGELPSAKVDELRDAGILYRSRDSSVKN